MIRAEREEPRGRFERDDESRASATAASVPAAATRADEGTAREDDTRRGGTGTLDRDGETSARRATRGDATGSGATPRRAPRASSPPGASPDGTPELLSRDDNDGSRAVGSRSRPASSTSRAQTVEQADELVAEVMKRLAEGFAGERERLEQQWGRGEDVSTEDLRVALQRYRSFFQRLLAA